MDRIEKAMILLTMILIILHIGYAYIFLYSVPCDGIDEPILMRHDFETGVAYLSHNQNYGFRFGAVTPSELLSGIESDCETLAHAIACLAEIKGVEYRYYFTYNIPYMTDNGKISAGHAGIDAYINGVWERMN